MKDKFNMEKIKTSAKEILLIVKKELKSNFTSPTAYIVMAVFLAILEFLYFASLMNIKMVYITPLLDNIPWLFLFLIPAITMASIAQETKEGTIEFYLTQPISEVQLLIGKFLSNYVFVIIATLLTLPAVISVASFGEVDWGQITAQYLGVFSLAFVLTAIGTFMSAIVKNQISAFLLSVLTSFALTIMGLGIVTQSLPVSIAKIFERIGIFSHYQALSGGALDLRDLIYFAAIGAVFLIASYVPLVKNKYHKKEPIYNSLKAIIVLLGALALSIAFLGEQIPGRIDLTQNKLYTLSDTTKNILAESNDVINITVYTSRQLPSQWQPQSRDIEEMLRDYDTYGKDKVIVTYKYTDDEEIETEAMTNGVQPVQFNTQSADEVSVQKGYLGIVISYLDQKEVMSFVESTEDLEYQLTKRINKLTTTVKPTVVFWDGKSAHSIYEDYTLFKQVLGDQFAVTSFTYSEEATTLPEGTTTLILTGPNEEFTQEEKDLIVNFMNNGGSVLALVDPVSVDFQTLTPTVNEFSLSEIFANYGLEPQNELLYDRKYNEIVSVGGGTTGSYLAQYPFWIKVQASEDSTITEGLGMMSLRWASPINVIESQNENETITPLIFSSQYSATQSADAFDIMLDAELNPTNDQVYSRNVAVAYQKTFEENDAIRIILVTDSDLLSDDTLQNSQAAASFGLNSVEWLTQSSSLNEIRQKNRDLTPLVFEETWQASALQYGNIVGVVAGLAIVGTFVIVRRSKKSKRRFE